MHWPIANTVVYPLAAMTLQEPNRVPAMNMNRGDIQRVLTPTAEQQPTYSTTRRSAANEDPRYASTYTKTKSVAAIRSATRSAISPD